ncbi:MAG: DUF6152 family protein [Gammaproteobacteria bacterium]
MNARTLIVFSGWVLLSSAEIRAHHSFAAEYDREQPITVTGTVTLLEWTNPHARLYVDAVDESGETVHWDLELGPPNGLMRLGWRRDSLLPGTEVTVEGFRSRTEPHVANARTVKLSDGREVFAGSSFDTTE